MGKQRRQSRAKPNAAKSKRNRLCAVENRQSKVRLSLPFMEHFLQQLNRELGLTHGSAFVRFVTDSEMKRLNSQFRKKHKTTDVLSFPSEIRTRPRLLRVRVKQVQREFLGDIAISPSVARSNAKRFHRSLPAEICVLMLHGLLHLLGYDHETDRGEMERVEATLRGRLGLA
jgi:probable rRNA maturation factor